MRTSDKIDQVAASMFAVNRDIGRKGLPRTDSKAKVQTKSGANYAYTYLSLPALIEYLQPFLEAAQLFVVQHEDRDAGGLTHVALVTTIFHFSGQFMELGPLIIPAPMDAQQRGSALTYARRYALAAAFNIAADEDDDAAKTKDWGTPPAPAGGTGPPAGENTQGEGVTQPAGSPTILDESGQASSDQWERLVAVSGGSLVRAVNRLNKVNGTAYTKQTAQAGATVAEVVAAITGEGA
jgi:hypothetical protein